MSVVDPGVDLFLASFSIDPEKHIYEFLERGKNLLEKNFFDWAAVEFNKAMGINPELAIETVTKLFQEMQGGGTPDAIISLGINILQTDPENIELANQSISKLNLTDCIKFEKKNFQDVMPLNNQGTLICNPPYGYRIGDMDKLKILYQQIGDHLKTHFKGFHTFILTGNLELLKHVGLRTKKKIILKNGMIDSRLAYYPIKDGNFK